MAGSCPAVNCGGGEENGGWGGRSLGRGGRHLASVFFEGEKRSSWRNAENLESVGE